MRSYTPRHNRPNSYRKIAQPEGHNSAEFLDVVWLWSRAHWRQLYDGGRNGVYRPQSNLRPGWYVVRRCDCHRGEVVIPRPYAREEQAFDAVRLLVDASMMFGTV
jgi:hypothetical protein